MAAALYDPAGGYYASGATQVGKAGDFFTSVSTGPVFGRLLAGRIATWWESTGRPGAWRIVELGAHDGSLAKDILAGLDELGLAGVRYEILEPLANLAAAQRENTAGLPVTVREDASGLKPLPTYLLANEVLDALPFQVVESDGEAWRELGVATGSDGFEWCDLGPAATDLPLRPKGYRTEIRPGMQDFLAPLAALLRTGRMLWIDYGFARSVYYGESRSTGTLRTYRRHQAGEDPLEAIGKQDITAHVDFTAAAAAMIELGGTITLFEDQGRALTRIAREWLLEREGRMDAATRKELLAFQTLIHPAHLGGRFHLLEAAFGEAGAASAAEALVRLELA